MMNHVATFTRACSRGSVRRIAGYTVITVRSREYAADVTITIDRTRTTGCVVGLLVTIDDVPVPATGLDWAAPADRTSAQAIYRWVLSRLAMGTRALGLLADERKRLNAFWAQREVEA
jgi:hypothetical protein